MRSFMPTENAPDSTQHECLQKLPLIFLKAMKGTSVMVNAFLGKNYRVTAQTLVYICDIYLIYSSE